MKNPPLQCRLSSKFFDYLLIFGEFIYICSVRYQFHSLLMANKKGNGLEKLLQLLPDFGGPGPPWSNSGKNTTETKTECVWLSYVHI